MTISTTSSPWEALYQVTGTGMCPGKNGEHRLSKSLDCKFTEHSY